MVHHWDNDEGHFNRQTAKMKDAQEQRANSSKQIFEELGPNGEELFKQAQKMIKDFTNSVEGKNMMFGKTGIEHHLQSTADETTIGVLLHSGAFAHLVKSLQGMK